MKLITLRDLRRTQKTDFFASLPMIGLETK
jgi:hypothetical protein